MIRNLVPGTVMGARRRALAFGLVMAAAALLATVAVFLAATKPAEAAFPGKNGKIAFSSDRTTGSGVTNPTGDYEIFTMNPNGAGILQATFNTASDFYAAWSPNGNKIAFASDRSGDDDIFVMNPDGSRQKNRTNNAAPVDDWAPVWQPIVP